MIRDKRYSNNFKISRELMRKRRQMGENVHLSSEVLFTFLYKYMSDNLKDYLNKLMDDEDFNLNVAYNDDKHYEFMELKSLRDLGYFFTVPEMFFDDLIEGNYDSLYLDRILFEAFMEGIKFKNANNVSKYFKFFYTDYKHKLYQDNLRDERNLIMRDLILSISRLDIFEKDFTYSQVFNAISNSGIVGANGTPEYISDILVYLVSRTKNSLESAYNPFLDDGSSLVGLYNHMHVGTFYGKERGYVNFLTSVVNMVICGVKLDDIIFFYESSLKSAEIEDKTFDAIISKIPNKFRNYDSRAYNRQSMEFSSKEVLKESMLSNLEIEENDLTVKMNRLLDDLISEKMAIDAYAPSEFIGEYESLMDNEFFFILNMIDSLKDDGIMIVSISQNFLFKNSLQIMRKFLTYEKNYLDAVISLPNELGRSVRPDVILIFKRNKKSKDILFIDPSKSYSTKTSDNKVPGTFRKYLLLDDESKEKILDCYLERKTIDKFSNLISLDEICENEFNLSISRYVDTYEGEFVDLEKLAEDKKRIDEEMDVLNNKIAKLMDDLDIKL